MGSLGSLSSPALKELNVPGMFSKRVTEIRFTEWCTAVTIAGKIQTDIEISTGSRATTHCPQWTNERHGKCIFLEVSSGFHMS
jgi:hypothetical protein